MTEGIKSPKDTLFFLTQDSEEEAKPNKKRPAAPAKNGSPIKQKTVGTKVLRNQRRAVQNEVHQTAMAKMIEHQRELHEALQARGVARFSEDGGGSTGKEGKVWKRFQSYKGEGALPPEIEKLRVRAFFYLYIEHDLIVVGLRRSQSSISGAANQRLCCAFPYQYY